MKTLDQGGDSAAAVSIADMFPSTGEDAGSDSVQDLETDIGDEGADSGVDEPEEETDQQPQDEDPAEAQDAQPGELTVEALAKEYGLDPNNPAHRKAIDKMLKDAKATQAMDKRIKDSQDYISNLREKISRGDFYAKFEKDLFKAKEEPRQEPPHQGQQRVTENSPAPANRFNDGYDHWKTAEDAEGEYAAAWEAGDKRKASEIRSAFNARWFKEAADPYVRSLINEAIERRIGPVLQRDQSQQQAQMDEDARFDALDALRAGDPDMAALLSEMAKPDGETIEINGRQVPSNAIWKLYKEYPEVMEIRVQRGNARESSTATWQKRYYTLAKLYVNQKRQSALATEKGEKIFKTAQQTAVEQAKKEKVRQSINSGTLKGKARSTSADDDFWAKVSASGGTHGKSVETLFRK